MNYSFSLNSPLQSKIWAKDTTLFKQISLILAGVFALAIVSNLSIPLLPVPLTFQSATVILIGMAYGARQGSYVILSYLIAGALGLPVFADFGFGMAKFVGPTGGYLIGFLPAAFLSGYLTQNGWGKNIVTSFITACLGASVIFLSGVAVLSSFVGWHNAILFGVMPFIVSEPIKLIAVSILAQRLWKKQ